MVKGAQPTDRVARLLADGSGGHRPHAALGDDPEGRLKQA